MGPQKKKKDDEMEEDHICVRLIIDDDKHALYLLNGRSYSVPISSLCSPIDQIEQENDQLKGSKVETIIEIDDGRPFSVLCEIVSNSKFKYKVCKVNYFDLILVQVNPVIII